MVVDTNVLVSGIFFSGPPYEILDAWRHCQIQLVYSTEVLKGELNAAPSLEKRVCADTLDDKFFACAISSGCRFIISGDKHLHQVSGFSGICVISPRDFFDKYLAT